MATAKNFKTQTAFFSADNPTSEAGWCVAIDVGYSSVKGYSRNHIFAFPSFIRKAELSDIAVEHFDKDTIQYKDPINGAYDVGSRAIELSGLKETYGSDKNLYGRERYTSTLFKILTRVGMAIGLSQNKFAKYEGEEILVQTGLPSDYKDDEELLINAFAGHHEFDIRFGGRTEWVHFDFTVKKNNVNVIPQPMGSFWCTIFDGTGEPVVGSNRILSENCVIFDGGFGTLDVHSIKKLSIEKSVTYPDCSMREVFKRTSDEILSTYGLKIPVPFLQKYLETGEFTYKAKTGEEEIDILDPSTYEVKTEKLDEILLKHSEAVAITALRKVVSENGDLDDYDNFIVTGGCGEAWKNTIEKVISPLANVIYANKNEKLSSIFNNVRGYYMYLLMQSKNKRKDA